MDESGDFKFTSREELLELSRQMELSGSEGEQFVVEQQDMSSECASFKKKSENTRSGRKNLKKRETKPEMKTQSVKEMEDTERQAELEHEQKMRDLEDTLRDLEREREVKERPRAHDAVQSACKTEDTQQ